MVEQYQNFIDKASETAQIIRNYQDTFETFNDLFPVNTGAHAMRGEVELERSGSVGKIKVCVEVNRADPDPDSDLKVYLSLKVAKNNYIKLSDFTLPNLCRVSANEMEDIGKNELIDKVVNEIELYSRVRESFVIVS